MRERIYIALGVSVVALVIINIAVLINMHHIGELTSSIIAAGKTTAAQTADFEASIATACWTSVGATVICAGFLALACLSIISNLSANSERLHQLMASMKGGVNQILVSVGESTDHTTAAAGAVNETTATIANLKATAKESSEKAIGVYQTSRRVAAISNTGRDATTQTIDGMKRIQLQMDQIADSMQRLSQKARNIDEIITTVDDLARQSTLLSFNAAIEAAKAGEHGKGFAVVAEEVKSLSKQSKQATAQVRAILAEIQTAASSAVKETSTGRMTVQTTAQQSMEAGNSIQVLAASISEAATAAEQIAAVSAKQDRGVELALLAMLNIKESTTRNVSIVSQAGEAASSLQALESQFQEVIETY